MSAIVQPRSLPHEPQAEAAVLGGIMLRGRESLDAVMAVLHDERDFYQPRSVAVFRAMRVLAERGEPIDAITLESQLRRTGELELCGGLEGLLALDRAADAQNIQAHASMIRESARVRGVALFGRQLHEELLTDKVDDVDAWIAKRQADLASLAKSGRRRRATVSIKEALDRTFAEMLAEAKGEGVGISTGFPGLDGMIKRTGPRGGMLVIVGAPPKFGKTTFALSMSRPYTRVPGYPVTWAPKRRPARTLWACDEMRIEELVQRQLADVTGLDGRAIGSPTQGWMKHHMQDLVAARRLLEQAPLDFVPDEDSHYLDRIFDYARHWRATHPIIGRTDDGKPIREPALLVLDYLQRFADLPTTSKGANKAERVGDKARACKTIAQELDVAVILLSQLNRAMANRPNKRPTRSDFRDSGEIEAEADVLIGLHRDIEYDEHADQTRTQEAELTRRSGLHPADLDAVVAFHGQRDVPDWVASLRERCQIRGSVIDELVTVRRRLSAAEVIVIANRHGPAGTVHVDFYGENFRFLPIAEPNDG